MIISFSGNDGSGKTTIGKTLVSKLTQKGIPIEYRHEYDYVFIKYLFKLLGNKRVEKERSKYLIKQDIDPATLAGKKLTLTQKAWPYIVWLDNLLTIICYKLFFRRKIIFLDRYPYDMYLSFEYMKRANAFLRFLFLSIPKADLQIIFYADPKIAMERKKSDHTYPIHFYEKQLKRYQALSHAKDIEMHNTEESLDETMEFVFKRLDNKAPKWLKYELQRN